MLRIHLFRIFIITTPWTLAALASLGLLILKTLTNVLTIRNIRKYNPRRTMREIHQKHVNMYVAII